jgi:hypothetical protein
MSGPKKPTPEQLRAEIEKRKQKQPQQQQPAPTRQGSPKGAKAAPRAGSVPPSRPSDFTRQPRQTFGPPASPPSPKGAKAAPEATGRVAATRAAVAATLAAPRLGDLHLKGGSKRVPIGGSARNSLFAQDRTSGQFVFSIGDDVEISPENRIVASYWRLLARRAGVARMLFSAEQVKVLDEAYRQQCEMVRMAKLQTPVADLSDRVAGLAREKLRACEFAEEEITENEKDWKEKTKDFFANLKAKAGEMVRRGSGVLEAGAAGLRRRASSAAEDIAGRVRGRGESTSEAPTSPKEVSAPFDPHRVSHQRKPGGGTQAVPKPIGALRSHEEAAARSAGAARPAMPSMRPAAPAVPPPVPQRPAPAVPPRPAASSSNTGSSSPKQNRKSDPRDKLV